MEGFIRTIQMIDKNGNVEVVASNEHNEVTNAYLNIFNQNVMPDALIKEQNNTFECYTPLQNLFKGILLFTNEMDPYSSEIIPTAEDFESFCGCAAGYYDGEDSYRGTFNSELSEITNDELTLVYDFDLDKVQNRIQTICLTSYAGGLSSLNKTNDTSIESSFLSAYRKSNLKNGECVGACGTMEGTGISSAYYIPLSNISKDGYIIGGTKDGIIFTGKIEDSQLIIKAFIYKSQLGFTDTSINFESAEEFETKCDGLIENTGLFKKLEETTIQLDSSITNIRQLIVNENSIYYVVQNSNSNFTITTITYNNEFSSTTNTYDTECSVTLTGVKTNGKYIYGINDNGTYSYLYAINLKNGGYNKVQIPDVTYEVIPYMDTIMLGDISATTANKETRIFYVYTKYGNLAPITITFQNESDCPVSAFVDCCNQPVIGTVSNYGNYSAMNMNIVTPYKATINCLSSAVTKGATNTMRITYVIRAI